ncbi:hypothetical protein [Idiomarina aquatica]|uniref:Uncharacterized protein n=1 Tax=Idiomarina aquatica TaxID=1327752 RepID=A0AA94JEB0_9GAMM|nr:hypothetical protein [Idiomarina aquatica]RUO44955.1 hypothetical protein CWE23_02705 [Idiomarina aquatica]
MSDKSKYLTKENVYITAFLFAVVALVILFVSSIPEDPKAKEVRMVKDGAFSECRGLVIDDTRKAGRKVWNSDFSTMKVHKLEEHRFIVWGKYLATRSNGSDGRHWYYLCDLNHNPRYSKDDPGAYEIIYGFINGPFNPMPEYKNSPFKK